MTSWLAYNSETFRLVIIPDAPDEDAARAIAAGPKSDGDEWSLVKIPIKGKRIDVTDKLGIGEV